MKQLLIDKQKDDLLESIKSNLSDTPTLVYSISYHLKDHKSRPAEYRALENAMNDLERSGDCIMLTGGNYAVKTKLPCNTVYNLLKVFLDIQYDFLSVIEMHKPLSVIDPDKKKEKEKWLIANLSQCP